MSCLCWVYSHERYHQVSCGKSDPWLVLSTEWACAVGFCLLNSARPSSVTYLWWGVSFMSYPLSLTCSQQRTWARLGPLGYFTGGGLPAGQRISGGLWARCPASERLFAFQRERSVQPLTPASDLGALFSPPSAFCVKKFCLNNY